MPSTLLELIGEVRDRTFGDSCAKQLLLEECRNWRLPWVNRWEPYRHPPGWPECYIDRQPVPPLPTVKVKLLKWEVDRAEQVAVALRQHLQVVREETVSVAAKAEVKWEEEKISQVSQ